MEDDKMCSRSKNEFEEVFFLILRGYHATI